MGNKQITAFQKQPWELHQTLKHYILLKNKNNQQIVQKHTNYLQRSNRKYDEELFQWRCSLPPQSSIVELLQYGIRITGICNNLDESYAVTENIQRFHTIRMLSKPQSFLLLKQILLGLEMLTDKFGYFLPSENQFGINQRGKCKVWINKNFASNEMENNIQSFLDQESIVNHLIELVVTKIARNICPHVYFPFNMKFRAAIKYLESVQLKQNGFFIDRITLFKESTPQETVSRVNSIQNEVTDYFRNSRIDSYEKDKNDLKRYASDDKMRQRLNHIEQPLFTIQQQKQSIISSNINTFGYNSINQSMPTVRQSKIQSSQQSLLQIHKSSSKANAPFSIINYSNPSLNYGNKSISIHNLIRNSQKLTNEKIIHKKNLRLQYQQQNKNLKQLKILSPKKMISLRSQLIMKQNLQQVNSELLASVSQ